MSFSAAGGAQSPARRLCFSRGAGFAEKSAKILREGLFFWAGIWYDKEHGFPLPTKIAKAIFVGALSRGGANFASRSLFSRLAKFAPLRRGGKGEGAKGVSAI